MTTPEWRKVRELYEKVAALPVDEARAVLESSSEDPAVKREVALVLDSFQHILEAETGPTAGGNAPAFEFPQRDYTGSAVGRYDVSAQIGCGSSGDVYSGRDRELGRPVALKFMKPDYTGAGSAARRFIREAQAASALNHPNIVTVYEVIGWEGSPVIVMELVEGSALRTLCGQPLAVPRVLRIGAQILQALAFAHANGIVHRDVKPENVMVRPDGYVKVLDLGLARQFSALEGQENLSSTHGLPVGTLRYMSPEQCRGESATAASDVFAAGLVLYEMLTGRHPFYADSPIETAHQIVSSSAVPPSKVVSQTPPAVESLILKMLDKHPANRPKASKAAEELEASLRGTKPQRRRVPVLMAAFACAAAAIGLALWLRSHQTAEKFAEFRQFTYLSPESHPTSAAVSPDGKSLAFADVNGSLHVQGSDGTTDRVVTRFERGQIDTIFWVPASRTLLLSGRDLTNDPFANYRIWTIDLEDGRVKELAVRGKRAAPSRDGSKIAYLSPNGGEIWVAKADGSEARRVAVSLGSLKFFTWSADNDLLYYWTVSERMESAPQLWKERMFSVDPASGRVVVEQPADFMFAPFALPGGRFLYYRPTEGLFEAHLDRATGLFAGAPRLLAPAESELHNGRYTFRKDLTASSDGRWVSGLFARDRKPHVYAADLLTPTKLANIRRLTLEDSADFPHTWTRDSKAVILESARFSLDFPRNGRNDLYIHPIDKKDEIPLVVMPEDQIVPMLSPDGRWVLFLSGGAHAWKLMRVPVSGGAPELVPTGGPVEEHYCGYKAKRCVLREMQGDQSVFFELDPIKGKGRELTRVVTGRRVFEDWTVSPDGSMVAMTNIGSLPATIRIIYLDQPPLEKDITFDGPAFTGLAAWTADGKGWYAAVEDDQMRLLDWAGHNRYVHDAGWWMLPSWDGKHVAYIDSEREFNVWTIGR